MSPRPDPQHVGRGRLYYADGTPRYTPSGPEPAPKPPPKRLGRLWHLLADHHHWV